MFVNTLPYISNPIEEFKDFKFVSWERDIYPRFKGGTKKEEIQFFSDVIAARNLHSIIDFGVGGGLELSGIAETLQKKNYELNYIEANEVDEGFIMHASTLFYKKKQRVLIHRANWLDLPVAEPVYEHP